MKNPDKDLLSIDIKDLNDKPLKYLDENFMLKFLDYVSSGLAILRLITRVVRTKWASSLHRLELNSLRWWLWRETTRLALMNSL